MATLTVDFFSSLDGNGSAHGWPGYWGKEGPELRDAGFWSSPARSRSHSRSPASHRSR